MTGDPMRKKRLAWVIATVVGIPALLYVVAMASFVLAPGAEDYAHRMAFDPAGWRNRSLDGDAPWPTRLRMADALIADRHLDGLRRGQVVAMLGPGDQAAKWKDWHLIYHLGPERGLFRIDSEWLVIRFDQSNRVMEYRIVRD